LKKTNLKKQIKINSDKASSTKHILVALLLFFLPFIGMFCAIVSIENFKNYYNPYLFAFIFGILGLISALIISKKIKPYIVLNNKMIQNYENLKILFIIGFIGITLLLGQKLNNNLSVLEKCENAVVLQKSFHKGGFRRVEKNILLININGENRKIISDRKYWTKISVGQMSKVCVYKSYLGFDFIELSED
jgi:hypothetical protein